ncbi:MAG: HAD-IIB family hydrolase [Veillonellales bacterium]
MQLFNEIPGERARKIEYILTDIDDTITENGKLPEESYTALWRLHNAGYKIIPVTGRPAGWCDLIIRQWPVDAIVGENGAFVYYFAGKQLKTFTHPSVAGGDIRKKLDKVKNAALQGVPGCRIAKDQFSRIYDLAIDFNEDPPYLGFEAAEKIKDICVSLGAEAKVSSIHVNAWFGEYDKLSMTELFMQQIWQEKNLKEKVLFFGDSPNDEPMFAYFPNSCAVANIKPFVNKMKHLPTYVTEKECGCGFAEAVGHLLSIK